MKTIQTGPGLGIMGDENKLEDEVGEPNSYLPRYYSGVNAVVDWVLICKF